MFSGIIEAIGKVSNIFIENECLAIDIFSQNHFEDLKVGDSIAVNGVCLTITTFIDNNWRFNLVPETLRLTNLSELSAGDLVNIERALKIGDRLSGHYVQGHIDATGEIKEITTDTGGAWLMKIKIPQSLEKYIVKKGFITIDGMSITVIDVTQEDCTVTLIPHTREVTIANQYRSGKKVNIETDVLGKYVEKLMRKAEYAVSN